ncbi:MAG TPA: cell wall hydrolase [Caulobacteraceae bacterium]|jgi:hypothetical protein
MSYATALSAPARPRAPFLLALVALLVIAVVGLDPAQLNSLAAGYWDVVSPSASAPTALAGLAAAPPFYLTGVSPAGRERAVRCLTDAIYYEAATEPEQGQRAVAQVVLNRLRDPHFPKTVCGVVYEGWSRRTGCQFSFTCDGSIRRRRAIPALWQRLRPLAEQALDGYVVPEVGASTHYYAEYVRPNWLVSVAQVTQIGQHIFCSWKGRAGQVSALTGAYSGDEFATTDAALSGQGGARPARHPVSRLRRVTGHLRVADADRGDGRA